MVRTTKQSGFTLIELSIVLVIIGLIVGGVVFGKDLIAAAEYRRMMKQLESYNIAISAFRNKYNGYPGDLPSATTFFAGAINGNGDSTLECNDTGNANADTGFACPFELEYSDFWLQLGAANLIEGKFDGGFNAGTGFPITKNHGGVLAYYEPSSRQHRFFIGLAKKLFGGVPLSASGLQLTFSHVNASMIDTKWDDGSPDKGNITAWGSVISPCPCVYPPAANPTPPANCDADGFQIPFPARCSRTSNSTPSAYNGQDANLLRLYFKMTAW